MNLISIFPTETALKLLAEVITQHEDSASIAQAAALDQWVSQPAERRITSRQMLDDLRYMESNAKKVQVILMRAHNAIAKL